MDASNSNDERQVQIQLNRDQIWIDTIKKELRHQKLYTEYTQNPYSKGLFSNDEFIFLVFVYTEKPNIDSKVGDIDGWYYVLLIFTLDNLRKMIERSRLEPRQKFPEPQTENQEYGWISTPLVGFNCKDQFIPLV